MSIKQMSMHRYLFFHLSDRIDEIIGSTLEESATAALEDAVSGEHD